MKFLIAFIFYAVATHHALASERLTTFGGTDCGRWVNASVGQKSEMRQWLAGYISGLNSLFNRTDPLGQITSVDQIFLWTDKYCKENPLNTVPDGAYDMLKEINRRMKK